MLTLIPGVINWWLMENFISEIEKLILIIYAGSLMKYYVNNERVFHILNETHNLISMEHGDINHMEYELGRL